MTISSSSVATLHALTNILQPARRSWLRAGAIKLSTFGSPGLAALLITLSRADDPMSQAELADELGIDPSAMVRLLDNAETAGLLERVPYQGDRRKKVVELRKDGVDLAASMEQALTDLRQEIFYDLPQRDVQAALGILRLVEKRSLAWVRRKQDLQPPDMP